MAVVKNKKITEITNKTSISDTDLLLVGDNGTDTMRTINWGDATEEISASLSSLRENLSNPNLLINGDFQVWQEGDSFENDGSSQQYTADGWCTYFKNRATKGEYIGMKVTATGNDYGSIYQFIEIPQCVANIIVGRDITLSVCMKTNRVRNCLIGFASKLEHIETSNNFVTYTTTKKLDSSDLVPITSDTYSLRTFAFACTNEIDPNVDGDVIEIAWCKVELGSIATPFVPRNYGEEWLLCQRYFQSGECLPQNQIVGQGSTTGQISTYAFLPVEMRVIPTVRTTDNVGNPNACTRYNAGYASYVNRPCEISATKKHIEFISRSGENANGLVLNYYADARIR